MSDIDQWVEALKNGEILNIHGQFQDLTEQFKVGGDVPETNYLFLGDLWIEDIIAWRLFLLLLALKVRYPDQITLKITQVYGFYDECLRQYSTLNVWKYCTEVFDYLALAAVVNDNIFCVHGGLSPYIKQLMKFESQQKIGNTS
ncbi:unnamed protein product [Paramecium octaurelia]|uniref:protein-serine/threonine phosphatase n=1 Tax=Paramecium octaurelia TaxID=43137 RepID=A0A8S1V707_PAROT|nr:unnamed protein product [Paramecium octaurelia]